MQNNLPISNAKIPAGRGTCEQLWSAIELVTFIQQWHALSMSSKAPFYWCCKVWCMCGCEAFLSSQVGTGAFPQECHGHSVNLTSHICFLLRLRTHRDLPSLDWCFMHRDSMVKKTITLINFHGSRDSVLFWMAFVFIWPPYWYCK